MNLIFTALLSLLLISPSSKSVSELIIPTSGNLVVSINNLKNTKGQIGILVFNKEQGFPSESSQAHRDVLIPITSETMVYTFSDLPYGDYAVSVMHDENKNNKLDKTLLGIPKEGNGVSNNVVGKMGPPKYGKAVFRFQKEQQTVQVKLRY